MPGARVGFDPGTPSRPLKSVFRRKSREEVRWMRVKMLQQVSGSRDGKDWPAPSEEMTLPDTEGAALCATGMAEPVAQRPKPETRGKGVG